MNITALVDLHLETYLIHENRSRSEFQILDNQIKLNQDLQDRRNFTGHVTSSFALLNSEYSHLLMIHHLGFDKWLFPGGHYEGDVSPRASALRELTEETGFPSELVGYLNPIGYIALDLDTHPIPARPHKNESAHYHHDFLYLGKATQSDVHLAPQLDEVAEVRWISLEEARGLPDVRTRRVVDKIISTLEQMSDLMSDYPLDL